MELTSRELKPHVHRLPYMTLLIALILLIPMLSMGFYADDYVHQMALRGDFPNSPMKPWALYDFGWFDDWKDLAGQVMVFPWWTGEGWHIRFFRPVSSIILWAQFSVFGEWQLGYILTGLALFILLLTSIFRLYLQLGLTESAARRGTLLFAVFQGVALPVGWRANQNSLIVALFAVLSLRLLVGSPVRVSRVGLGLLAACAAMLAKESGCASVLLAAMILFWRLRTATDRKQKFIAGLGVFVALAAFATWAAFIVFCGYGTQSLFYATPWADPLRFAKNLLMLLTGGIACFYGPFPLDLITMFPSLYVFMVIAGALIAFPISCWVGWRVRRRSGVVWLLLWVVLFLVLQAGGPPAGRLLFVPAIGFMGLLGWFFEEEKQRRLSGQQLPVIGYLVTSLWLLATIGAGSATITQAFILRDMANYVREKAMSIQVGSELDGGHRTIFILQSESQMEAFALHSTLAGEANPQNISLWSIQSGNRPLRWTRIDETTFDVETNSAPFLSNIFERVLLSETPDFQVGHRWETECFTVEAMAVNSGMPTMIRIYLDKSLDDENVFFLRSTDRRYSQIIPPGIGEAIDLEQPNRAGPFFP